MDFVTVESVDAALGAGWATTEQKAPAVAEANVWLTARLVSGIDPITPEIVSAGALVAQASANGQLYVDQTGDLKMKRVRVEGAIETESEWQDGAAPVSAFTQRINDLLGPWLKTRTSTRILMRL